MVALDASSLGAAIARDARPINVLPRGVAPVAVAAPAVDAAPVAPVVHPPDAVAYWKICGGTITDIFWVTPKRSAPAAQALPAGVAGILSSLITNQIQVPRLGIALVPPGAGITGLESYFWISGYDGSPISRSVTSPPYQIDLRATPSSYVWSFGDGTGLTTTSLGLAYPQISPIRHMYQTKSSLSPLALNGAYRVTVTVQFDTLFRVAGPGLIPRWVDFTSQGLQPLTATASFDYRVGEIVVGLTSSPPPGP
jgi:hypothetical protein